MASPWRSLQPEAMVMIRLVGEQLSLWMETGMDSRSR
jgi:hypothetical protein